MPVPCDSQPGPDWVGRARWTMRWNPVVNAFAITFGDRWPAAETYWLRPRNTDLGTDPPKSARVRYLCVVSLGWV